MLLFLLTAREVRQCADPRRRFEYDLTGLPALSPAASAPVCAAVRTGANHGVKTGEIAALLNRRQQRDAMNLSRFYAVHQIEYCRNFIFKRHFPIHKVFERSCELGLWCLTAHKISEIFGIRLTRKFRGKLSTVVDQIEHGHHVYR